MLRDIHGHPLKSGLDDWSNFSLIPASGAQHVRGLEEIAAHVAAGTMPPDTPVLVATKEADGGYPAVVVAVPLSVEELRAWQTGDRSTSRDVVEALEVAYEDFMEQVKANRIE